MHRQFGNAYMVKKLCAWVREVHALRFDVLPGLSFSREDLVCIRKPVTHLRPIHLHFFSTLMKGCHPLTEL